MNDIELKLENESHGAFVIEDGGRRLAEMTIVLSSGNVVVHHTQVAEELQGQGIAGKLLDTMVDYARTNHLKVVPLCPYVQTQFKRRPEKYADVWNQDWHG